MSCIHTILLKACSEKYLKLQRNYSLQVFTFTLVQLSILSYHLQMLFQLLQTETWPKQKRARDRQRRCLQDLSKIILSPHQKDRIVGQKRRNKYEVNIYIYIYIHTNIHSRCKDYYNLLLDVKLLQKRVKDTKLKV